MVSNYLTQWQAVAASTLDRKTARVHAARVKQFLWSTHTQYVQQITPAAIQDYIAQLCSQEGYAPGTVRNHYSSISHLCNHLVSRGVFRSSPCDHIRLPKIRKPIVNYLTKGEVRQALVVAEYLGIGLPVRMAIYTGLHRAELRRLEWDNIHLDNRVLVVRGKGSKIRSVPLADAIYEHLAVIAQTCRPSGYVFPSPRSEGRPISLNKWSHMLAPLQEYLPQITGWHIFRHTFASLLAQQGCSSLKLAAWLGHSQEQLTKDYYINLAPEQFDDDINRLTLCEGGPHGERFESDI